MIEDGAPPGENRSDRTMRSTCFRQLDGAARYLSQAKPAVNGSHE